MVLDGAYHMGSWSGAVCTPSRHMVMSGRTVWHLPRRGIRGEKQNPLCRLFERVRAASAQYEGEKQKEYVVNAFKEDLAGDFESVLERLGVPGHFWQLVDMPAFFALCYFLGPTVKRATNSFLHMTSAAG